jgi:adenylate cyclase
MAFWTYFRHPIWRGVWLGLACAGLAALLGLTDFVRGIEDWMLDGCFFIRGSRDTKANVVLIGLDDESLRDIHGPLLFISPKLTKVVAYANKQGARAVGIDVLVPGDQFDLPEVQRDGRGDATTFGQLVLDSDNIVLPQWLFSHHAEKPLLQWLNKSILSEDPTDVAAVNLTPDGDQFIRRQALLYPRNDGPVPHFALALYAKAHKVDYEWDDKTSILRLDGRPLPLDKDQVLRINFAGPPGRFKVIPFKDVLAAERESRPMPELNGAIVIVGMTTKSQQDYHSTPYANQYASYFSTQAGLMSGPEVHANILATLEDQAYIHALPRWAGLAILFVSGIGLGMLFARLSLQWGLAAALAHHIAWKGVAVAAFVLFSWRVEMMEVLVLGFLAYTATFAWRWRSLRRMFGVVKSESVALALETDPRRLDARGEDREITVLFADVRAFTAFAETRTDPHDVLKLLNAYYSAIVPAIEAEGGTVNTYMGDGVMVMFGAPAHCADHALRAVRAAVTMVRRVRQKKQLWADLGFPGLRIGVGVHTGKVVVGAIGSPGRLDYTAIGDTVNAAARIESETKNVQAPILISSATYALVPPAERGRLGCTAIPTEAAVKGRKQKRLLHAVTPPDS